MLAVRVRSSSAGHETPGPVRPALAPAGPHRAGPHRHRGVGGAVLRRPPGSQHRTGSTGWPVAHLGPDLTGPEPDLVAVLGRLDGEDPARPLLDVLLDQRVAAGLGNVYKSELLWRQRLAPELALGRLDQEGRQALYRQAHQLLGANLGTGPRVAAPGCPAGWRCTGVTAGPVLAAGRPSRWLDWVSTTARPIGALTARPCPSARPSGPAPDEASTRNPPGRKSLDVPVSSR